MHWLFPTTWKKLVASLRKLCEEPDCMFSENCVVWTATWVLLPINVVSSPPPSFLLYFLFWVTSFLKRVSLGHFSNVYFSQCRKLLWKKGKQHLLFVVKKNSLFVLSIVETSLLWILIFVDFSKTKQISIRHFFAKRCKKKLCWNILLRNFFLQKNLTKTKFFLFGRIFLFSFFILFHLGKAFLRSNTCFISFIALYLSLSKIIPAKKP